VLPISPLGMPIRESALRPLRHVATVAAALASIGSNGCGAPTAPTAANYLFSFHQDTGRILCPLNERFDAYCTKPAAVDTTLTGSLTHDGPVVHISIGNYTYLSGPQSALRFDSTYSQFDGPSAAGCHSMILRMTVHDEQLRGTWIYASDCHGMETRSGTLVGTRQP